MATEEQKVATSGEGLELQERAKVANPAELLQSSLSGLDKFGGFQLLKGLIKGVENMDPRRKAVKNVVNLFIFGDEDVKVKRIMEKYNLTEAKAKDMIIKKDKQRQSYYNYYSSKKWGRADSYDLCINSSILGIDGTVKLIIQYIEDFEKKNN